jgi:hypothetical protein
MWARKRSTACRRALRPVVTLLLAALFLSSFLSAGCSVSERPAWRHPGFDPNGTNSYPVAWNPDWKPTRVAAVGAPVYTPDEEPSAFLGDVWGSPDPELVLADRAELSVLDMDGRLLGRFPFPVDRAAPAFLHDMDADGKLDLVAGSVEETEPTFFVMNGAGETIHHYTVEETSRDYRSFKPRFVRDKTLYIMTQENWVDSPRGFIRYSLPDEREDWEFHIPGDPEDLRIRERSDGEVRFVTSYVTRPTGFGLFLGIERIRMDAGSDAGAHLIQFDEAGRTHTAAPIRPGGEVLRGDLDIYPLPAGAAADFFMLRRPVAEVGLGADPTAVDLFTLQAAGAESSRPEITASRRVSDGNFRGVRLLQTREGLRTALLWRSEEGPVLELLDEELRSTLRTAVPGTAVRMPSVMSDGATSVALSADVPIEEAHVGLGPVLDLPGDDRGPSLFVFAGDELLLFDHGRSWQPVLTTEGGRRLLLTANRDGGLLVTIGDRVEIWRLR